MDNSLLIGEPKTLAQLITDDFSETNGVFEDSVTTKLGRSIGSYNTLKVIKMPNVTTGNNDVGSNLYLKKAYFPKCTGNLYNNFFDSDYRLSIADAGMVTGLNQRAIGATPSLSHFVLRGNAVVGIGTAGTGPMGGATGCSLHPNMTGDVHVYVPQSMISQYEVASGWTDIIANRPTLFRAIEDYSIDGTVTGELNETLLNPTRTVAYSLDEQVFDGSSVYFDTDLQLFDGTNKFTICIDYTPNNPQSNGTLLHCTDNSENGFLLRKSGTATKNYFKFLPPGTTLSSNTNDNYWATRDKVWLICDGTRLTMVEFNGDTGAYVRYWNPVASGTPTAISDTLLIGAAKDSNNSVYRHWKGTVHKLRVYKDILSPGECNDILEI